MMTHGDQISGGLRGLFGRIRALNCECKKYYLKLETKFGEKSGLAVRY